ncbi:Sugar kinase of the NBD/HSP70 family, may contain an N-terminal HTH domain [Pontibacter chinhatensis]|uniref:Sugar kinase of the NBD/HSP70 family, may contain an N-terminal HTH domain n=2 Tax=Pontibacter chinhatensis TaxID=1436961 RepID=A0A1I2RFT8_9BACT|nr:Sugar kinase of the NBD/HSP70 family, may contain an N-terminal HTH domain [Pontibacter chinhatensis]
MFDKQVTYKRNIVKHLYFAGELSCADLSTLTNKSVPLTARMLNELIGEGTIVEKGYAVSTGGRRPLMYSLKPDLMYIVSVAMDQLVTRIALLDVHNNYIGEVQSIDLPLAGNSNALHDLGQHLKEFLKQAKVAKNSIIGVGIGMPGFVDVVKGVNHSFLKVEDGTSIISYLESVIKLPVLIDNDSSLVALAEHKLGTAKDRQNVMVLSIGWGIGLGMVLDGALFRGHNGFAGEFSHIPIFMNNKMCSCGKSGCLETETSLVVVAERAVKGLQEGRVSMLQGLSLDDMEATSNAIMEAALKGDRFAIELFSETAYNIGRGVATLIHLLNPELIVLSGRGSLAGKLWMAPIQQAINEHCIPKIAEDTEIRISTFGYQAEIIGAAALVMEHYDTLSLAKSKMAGDHQVV